MLNIVLYSISFSRVFEVHGITRIFLVTERFATFLNRIYNFKGILIGNSAGAIVLSNGSVDPHEGKIFSGFGLAKFFITVHFNLDQESTTEKLEGFQIEEIFQ